MSLFLRLVACSLGAGEVDVRYHMDVAVRILHSGAGLAISVLLGSFLISKLLKISPLITLGATALSLAAPHSGVSVVQRLSEARPGLFFGATWGSFVALGSLATFLRPTIKTMVGGIGVFRLSYLLSLWIALVVVGLLCVEPAILERYAPHWKATTGWFLLGASLLSVSHALGKMVRAGFLLVLWSAVSIILASELFLNKMPHMIQRDDLTHLEAVVSTETAQVVFNKMQRILALGRGVMGVAAEVGKSPLEVASEQATLLLQPSTYKDSPTLATHQDTDL